MGFMSLLPHKLRSFSLFRAQVAPSIQRGLRPTTVEFVAKTMESGNQEAGRNITPQMDLFSSSFTEAPRQQDMPVAHIGPVKSNRIRSLGKTEHRPVQGKLVLSGRMSDVCAELDRLIALEGRQAGQFMH